MKLSNHWVECLNCGQQYSLSEINYISKDVSCPQCLSKEYIVFDNADTGIQKEYSGLYESLEQDGEWN